MELIKILKQLLDLFFAYQKDTRNGIPIWKDSGFIASTAALLGALVAMGTGVQMPVDLPVLLGAYLAANLTNLLGPNVGIYKTKSGTDAAAATAPPSAAAPLAADLPPTAMDEQVHGTAGRDGNA